MADRAEPENIQATANSAKAGTDPALVFIGYSWPDAAAAPEACGALERNGHAIWIAPRDVVAGEFAGSSTQ